MSDQLLSGNITFAGLGSGTDFNALIDGLMKVEQRRITQLENWRKSWDDKIVQFKELNTKLLSLKTKLETMNTPGKFLVKNAASTNEASFTATAGADAISGSYNLKVNALAKNSIWTSGALSSATTDIVQNASGGQLSFTIDGKTVTTSISDGQNLNDLANAINANAENRYKDADGVSKQYVRASVVKTQSSPEQFVLQLTSLDQGKKYEISGITPTDLDLTFPGTATQVADDAEIEFNGLVIKRSSNSIDDIIPGVTLNLKKVDATGGTITVAMDKEAVKEHVVDFVDAVNEVRTKLMELTKVDNSTKEGSILTGNYGVQIIDQRLKDIIAQNGLGFQSYNSLTNLGDYYSSLSQLCILTERDGGSINKGLLVFDEFMLSMGEHMTFDKAFDANPEAVANLFAANRSGVTNTSDFSFISDTGLAKPGTYTVSYEGNGTGVVDNKVTINGTVYSMNPDTREVTCDVKGNPEHGLVIRINNVAAGPHGSYPADHFGTGSPEVPYTVSIQRGKINELIDELKALTDPKSGPNDFEAGPLAVLEENYNDIIKSINTKIEYEERRITRMKNQYKQRFARLDAMLGYYNNLSASMQTQIISMMQQS